MTSSLEGRSSFFESHDGSPGHDLEDWLRAESELLHPVLLNVTESNGKYVVRAELPGFGGKDIEISVEPRCLAISGKRETKEEAVPSVNIIVKATPSDDCHS